MTETCDYLFVYGTLMQGFANDFSRKLYRFSTWEGNGSFPGMLYAVSWYPGALYLPAASTSVYGEVYRLPTESDLLAELDEYEDITEDKSQSLYLRVIVPVLMKNNMIIPCWTYLYNQSVENLKEIKSGDFRNPV